MSSLKAAIFVKNLPVWERVLRLLLTACVVIASLLWLKSPWNAVVALSAIGFGLTAVFGFCPACAMFGRKLQSGS